MGDIPEHALDHRIRFDECGADGLLRSGGYLRLMQDLAWRHSEALGMSREWYHANRLAWLVRFADLRIVGEARSGDTLQVTTRIIGRRRVWARRESIASAGGATVAAAVIDWVLIDEAGRPARIPAAIAERFSDDVPPFEPGRVVLGDTPVGARETAWPVSIRDLDPMGHVNNATYLDVIDEALAADTGALAGPPPQVRYQVTYLRPALPRTTVSVLRWDADGVTSVRCVDHEGQDLLRASVSHA